MKTVFDEATRTELINRIKALDENSAAEWGRMNVYQMLKHCTLWEEMIFGNITYKRVFIGRIFGRLALWHVLKNDAPLGKNTPTIPEFVITEKSGDVAAEITKWIGLIERYEHYSDPFFIHDFFGKMTREQVGLMAYKHADHHLRQFGR